jgi:hypothetical protein
MGSLFSKLSPNDCNEYRLLMDEKRYEDKRAFIDCLWSLFRPFADPNFESEFRTQFQQRYWEMFLACSLLLDGLPLIPASALKSKMGRPDLCIAHEKDRIWVEAIAVTAGTRDDAVPKLPNKNTRMPGNEIVLRLCHAIQAKSDKIRKYIAEGTISPRDACIIAINVGEFAHYASLETTIPFIVQAVLPYGIEVVTIDASTRKVKSIDFEHRGEIAKRNRSLVNTSYFENVESNRISGLLYSIHNIWDFDLKVGGITMVHNPMAAIPLVQGCYAADREYWVNADGELCNQSSN